MLGCQNRKKPHKLSPGTTTPVDDGRLASSVPRVTVWHHSAEPRDAKTMTLGTDLSIRTSHLYQILILHRAPAQV